MSGGLLVLNVNDEDAPRYVISRILRQSGFAVAEARTGREALERAVSEQPEAILLDVKLPDIDGLEVCRRLKTDPATQAIPVVMVSALLVEDIDRVHGLESGADGYLTHPLHPAVLGATIRALLRARRAEQAQRESEAQYRALFERNPLPAWVLDVATLEILAVNEAAIRHYGYSRAEFEALSADRLRHPDERAKFHELMASPTRGAQFVATRHVKADGAAIDVEVTTTRLTYHGRDARLVVVHDVTARKQMEAALKDSEERFRRVFDDSPLGMAIVDSDGRFVEVNASLATMFGYRREVLRELRPSGAAEGAAVIVAHVATLFARATPSVDLEADCAGNDGRRFRAQITASLLGGAGGRPTYALAIVRDVTEQRVLEERDRLRALSLGIQKAREDEARRIAHELHNEAGQLLASVHIELGQLARETGAVRREQLERIRGLLGLTEERLRGLAHELRPAMLDDLGLIPAVQSLVERVQLRSGVPIGIDRRDLDERLPAPVETALYRIVQEALTNVVRHASAASVEIRLAREAGTVTCVVADDGVGFDPDAVLKAGRGLGLIGLRERVDALAGRLHLDARPGAGTRITVTLPLDGGDDGP